MTSDPGLLVLAAWLLPITSFLVLGLVYPFRRLGRPAAWFSTLCAACAFGSAVMAWRIQSETAHAARIVLDWLPSAGGSIATVGVFADQTSTTMLCLVTLVSLLVQLYSLGYLHDEPPTALGRYYTYQSLFAFSMIGLVLAPNLLQLFMCWELVGLCSYLLIGFWYTKPSAARAAAKAFWITKAGDVGLLIGMVLLYTQAKTYDFLELRSLVATGGLPAAGLTFVTIGLYIGAMGKSAQFPMHIWLPDAMEGPTPVSALIHAATMVTAGVYLLVRTDFLFAQTPGVLHVVAWIGALTALVAAILACVQDDIKRVLAYSTVSQLGYMMTAIGAGTAAAGFFHLLTHGVFKALLFLGAGSVIHAVGSNDLPHMGGLAKRMPQTALVFVIGTLSLAGVPFFAGFSSKEEILGAVWTGGLPGPFAILMLVAFLTAFYMFRVVFLAFLGEPGPAPAPAPVPKPAPVAHGHGHDDHHGHAAGHGHDAAHGGHGGGHGHPLGAAHAHEPPATMLIPLWVLALLSLALGVYFTLGLGHAEAEPEGVPGWLTPSAISAAIAGIGLAWFTYGSKTINGESLASAFGPIRAAALQRFWIDDVFIAIYKGVLMGIGRVIGWLDRYIVDGVLNVVSAWTLTAGDDLRTIQTGKAQDYVYGVAVGVLILVLLLQLKP